MKIYDPYSWLRVLYFTLVGFNPLDADKFYHFWIRAQRLAQLSNQPNSVDAFRNFEDEAKYRSVWSSDPNGNSSMDGAKDNLAALYRTPFALMFQGSFEQVLLLILYSFNMG